jgi:catechol 2,3-dioxygenase-like lactoylglutathione lyase family enzyme
MVEETLVRSSMSGGSSHRPTRAIASLRSLGTTPSAPVRVDPRGQEGRELLGLLHEAGVASVERRYASGEVIFGEGDPDNALYFLTEGVVKLSRIYSEGKEATLMLLGSWEVFGELAFGRRAYEAVQKCDEETGFVIHMAGPGQHTETQAKERKDTEMIKDVPLTGIFVNDQDEALHFYTNKLGLQKIQDEPYSEGTRWITVSPADMKIRIVLKKAEKEHEKAMVGRSDGTPILTLGTDDVRSAYEALRERGVRFLGEPYRHPWGIGALLLDQDGSPILLQQESNER